MAVGRVPEFTEAQPSAKKECLKSMGGILERDFRYCLIDYRCKSFLITFPTVVADFVVSYCRMLPLSCCSLTCGIRPLNSPSPKLLTLIALMSP